MILSGSRTRVLAPVLAAAVSLVLGCLFIILYETGLESEPLVQEPPISYATNATNTTNSTASTFIRPAPDHETEIKQWPSTPPRVACVGPRGLDLNQDNDDSLRESAIDNLSKSSLGTGLARVFGARLRGSPFNTTQHTLSPSWATMRRLA